MSEVHQKTEVLAILALSGRAVFTTKASPYRATHWARTGFVLVILLLNWWATFSWREIELWRFDLFLVFISAANWAVIPAECQMCAPL